MNRPFQSFSSLICQPLAIAGILLLAVNDLLLQRYFPGWLTGKLGDFAWFLFAPYLLAALIALLSPSRQRTENLAVGLAYGLALAGFAAVKTIPAVNGAVLRSASHLGLTLKLALDPGDLLAALAGSLLSWAMWKRPLPDVRLPRKASLALLAASALVIAADMAAPNPGIDRLQAGSGFLKASDLFSVYVSSDGGLTWQDSQLTNEQMSTVQPQDSLPRQVQGAADVRYTPGESIERSSDEGQTWQVIYRFSQMTEVDQQYYLLRSPSTNTMIGLTPIDAVKDPQTGNVVFAMGHEGVLVYTPGGDWIWASVGLYTFDRSLKSGRVSTLLMFPALIALILAGLAFGIFSLSLRQRWWKWLLFIPAAAVGVLMAFSPPAGFQSGYDIGMYALIGSGLLTGLMVIFGLIECVDLFKGAAVPMALWALFAGLIYLVGPVLWVLRILPKYTQAALLGVGLTVLGLVWGSVRIAKVKRKIAQSGPMDSNA